jgi:hypothetical protein
MGHVAVMDKRILRLINPTVRQRAIDAIWGAPDEAVVTIAEPSRNGEQNAKFHALCSDLAKSGLLWAGKRRTLAEWKVLMVSGHAVATKEGAEIVPGIEGEFVNIRESTALMSKKRGSSLIEYTVAFMAMREVTQEHA